MAFQINPQMRKLHEKQKPADAKPHEGEAAVEAPEEMPAKGHMEVHQHGEGAGFHTITHQPHEMQDGEPQEDGSVAHDHSDLDMVMDHMKKHFGEELQEAKGENEGEDAEGDGY